MNKVTSYAQTAIEYFAYLVLYLFVGLHLNVSLNVTVNPRLLGSKTT